MKIFIRVAAFSLLLLPMSLYAQEPSNHPIDKQLGVCTEKDPSTAGMVSCIDVALKKWDQELNRNYLALMKKLKPTGRRTLKSAQVEWIKHRDTEFALLDSIYSTLEGTMYIPMHLDQKMQIVRHRALALSSYLELLADAEP